MSKRLTLAGLAVAALLASACGSAEPAEKGDGDDRPYGSQAAIVERAVDADTVVLDVKESGDSLTAGAGQEVQLLEMDAPEAQAPGHPSECWGPEAARYAEGVLPAGLPVYVLPGGDGGLHGGRLAAYLWLESGVLYNELAVRDGQARAVPEVFIQRLRAAEAEAKAANRGMWGPPCDYDAGAPAAGVPAPGAPKG
ncbi:MAG: thermonuclease family protein [Actinomycetota bacterium]|nr:thermonuclease family protein [Actinomycetota bacterium]